MIRKCKKYQNIILNATVYYLFFLSILFYLLSLKGCHLTFNECALHTMIPEYFKLGVLLILSSLFFGVLISIQIISRLNYINYFLFFITYIIIFIFTQGNDFSHHGTYNNIIFILFCPIFSIIFYIIYIVSVYILNLELKKLLVSLLFIFNVITFFFSNTKCLKFYEGIGGEKLINSKELNKCFIKKPRYCGYDFLSGLFDFSYFRKKTCSGFNDRKNIFFKYLNASLEIYNNFSYPRTEFWDPNLSYQNLADLVEKGINFANETNSKNNEVFVSFKDDKGKIYINLKKNKSLVQLKRIIAKNNPVKFNNIYMIYFDALSRNNFIRKLKKSTQIIENTLYNRKGKSKLYEKYNSFQFFKYHSFDAATKGNTFPLFFGNRIFTNKGISMIHFLNQKGFITAAAHNSCNREIYDWENIDKNIKISNFDHENVALFCDPNFEDKTDKWSIKKGKSAILRRCFYGLDSFEYNFEYILQFLDAYKSERKFFRVSFGDGHEATTEVIKYIDNSFSKFITKIMNDYFDDKTAIIILSDHGAHIPGPYDILFFEEKNIEEYLGLFLLILPNNNLYKYNNLFFNQQQLMTPYDIYHTILDILNVDKYKYDNIDLVKGQSLFLKINGKNRSCESYQQEINNERCFCKV